MRWWRWRYAVPSEHGTWIWWLGPLAIGLAAGGRPQWDFPAFVVAALGAFLLHQPATIAVKALAGRRPRADLAPALVWVALHLTIVLLAAACLVASGHARVLALAAPGVLVFAVHLGLVHRHAERRQRAVEMLAAGSLALAAPGAYWVAGGNAYPEPWVLWALTWLQASAGISNVYLRLAQRRWASPPPYRERLRAGGPSLAHHVAGLAAAVGLAAIGEAPWGVSLAFGLVLLEAVTAVLRPLCGVPPRRIGFRQLALTIVFVAVVAGAYLLR